MGVLGLQLDGRPAVEPVTASELAAWLREGPAPPGPPRHFGPTFGPGEDPNSLAAVGWGVLWGPSCPQSVKDALSPLIEARRIRAGELFTELTWDGTTSREWLQGLGVDAGFQRWEHLPYYVLVVGPPTDIPFGFQYAIDVDYAVGRVGFEYGDLDAYAAYARSVLSYEADGAPLTRRELYTWAPRTDEPTMQSEQLLMGPLVSGLPGDRRLKDPVHTKVPGWTSRSDRVYRATRNALLATLHQDAPPAVVVTASHGLSPPGDDLEQMRALAGALVSHDYPGFGPVKPKHLVRGADVEGDPHGLISVHWACYGAGVPLHDAFPRPTEEPRRLAPEPFLSALPQALLSRPGGGALAVIGHVERAWSFAFRLKHLGPQLRVMSDLLQGVMRGDRVGHAMGVHNARHERMATELAAILSPMGNTQRVKDLELVNTWTEYTDAKNHVLLGDPAVRLLPHRLA